MSKRKPKKIDNVSIGIAKRAAEESVPFQQPQKEIDVILPEQVFSPANQEVTPKKKEKVADNIVKVDDFIPPVGVSKRRAWHKWKQNIEKMISNDKEVVIVKENGEEYPYTLTNKKAIEVEKTSKKESRRAKRARKAKEKEEALAKVILVDDPEEDFDSFIEIAVSCNLYQKRLNWMLSSILQQKGDVPSIIFNVAYPKNNGNPSTEKVCEFFRNKGLNIKETVYDDMAILQYRGFARNRQLIESKAKWMMFADCDMAYSSLFFSDLAKQLRTTYKEEKTCISSTRISLDKKHCKDTFNMDKAENYPKVIENIGQKLSKWPVYMISRCCGAGYFQLFNVRTMRKNTTGLYVLPDKNKDLPEQDKYHKTYSDRQFRCGLLGVKRMKTEPMYHLNHERDNETRKHITIQR